MVGHPKSIGIKKLLLMVLIWVGSSACRAQSYEVQQLLLNVEKLAQFKQILKDMKEGYQVIGKGYETVKDLSQGNFNLHEAFLDGLLQVSPTVRNYRRVLEIGKSQLMLVQEYRKAFERFKDKGNFDAKELSYIKMVMERLLSASVDNMDDLLTVLTAGKLRMGDEERLSEIDRIYSDMQEKLVFLRIFINEQSILDIQRSKNRDDAQRMQRSYGISE